MDGMLSGLRTRDLGEIGLARRRQLSSEWVTIDRGVHVPRYVSEDEGLTAVCAAVALMGPLHVLGGWAALAFQGVPFFDAQGYGPKAHVHCLPGSQLRPRALIAPLQGRLHPDEWSDMNGVNCVTIARAAFDQMRLARTLEDAVVVADMAASHVTSGGRTTLDAIARVIDSHPKTRGVVRAREAIALAGERSASPWETRLRMRAERDLQMNVLVNVPIFDLHERLLGIADLVEPSTATVLESDGAHHRELENHRDDNEREEKFEDAGMAVGRFTAADHGDRWALVRRIEQVRRRGRSSPLRAWTLDEPDWWPDWEPGRRYRRR